MVWIFCYLKHRKSVVVNFVLISLLNHGNTVQREDDGREDEVGEEENEASPEEPTPVAERDDETNPYWIEDDRLKLGKVGRISILGEFLIQF